MLEKVALATVKSGMKVLSHIQNVLYCLCYIANVMLCKWYQYDKLDLCHGDLDLRLERVQRHVIMLWKL